MRYRLTPDGLCGRCRSKNIAVQLAAVTIYDVIRITPSTIVVDTDSREVDDGDETGDLVCGDCGADLALDARKMEWS